MPFHRISVGDFEIIAIQAQPNRMIQAAQLFPTVDHSEFDREFDRDSTYFGKDSTELRFTQNICLVRTGAHLVLVDTGVPHDREGALLLSGLNEAGISVNDITMVILTHRDMDHVGGNLVDGKPTFPNARYAIGRSEYEGYKVDPDRDTFGTFVAPLEAAGVLDIVSDDAEIVPGMRLWLTPGHRSGATSVLVGEGCLLTADVWHHPAQVGHPEWHIGFDSDADLASGTRAKVIAMAAEKNWLLAVPHTPEFGLGRIGELKGERVWVSVVVGDRVG